MVASSGHTTPTLCRRMPSGGRSSSSRPRSFRAWRVSFQLLPLAMMPKAVVGRVDDVVVQLGWRACRPARRTTCSPSGASCSSGGRASGCAGRPGASAKVFRQDDLHAVGVDEPTPDDSTTSWMVFMPVHTPGEAAHGEGVQAHVQDFLHAGGKNTGSAAGLEDVVALVRRCCSWRCGRRRRWRSRRRAWTCPPCWRA